MQSDRWLGVRSGEDPAAGACFFLVQEALPMNLAGVTTEGNGQLYRYFRPSVGLARLLADWAVTQSERGSPVIASFDLGIS